MSGSVEVSGSTPLTQRLVREATEAIVRAESTSGFDDSWERSGRAAAVALLRELSEEAYGDHWVFDGAHLEALAESVERGDTT